MTWLSAFELVALGVFIGVASSLLLTSNRQNRIWAIVISAAFTLALLSWTLFEYSWMFTAEARRLAQSVALVTGVSGFIFGTRARD